MDLASHPTDMTGGTGDHAISMPAHLDDIDALFEASDVWDLEPLPMPSTQPDLTKFAPHPNSLSATGASTDPAIAVVEAAVGQRQRYASKEDHRLAVGRETQRRFRQRQKARKESIEADLATTKAQLKGLKQREQQLQARNALLERVAILNDADVNAHAQVPICAVIAGRAVSGKPILTLNLWEQKQELDLQAVSQMTFVEFSRLWTGYMHKLGNILLDCDEAESVPYEPLRSVLMEAASLYCCVTAYNVAILKHAYANGLDNGQANGREQLGDAFYTQLLAMVSFSQEQVSDLLYLRRMCIIRRGQLANQRKAQALGFPAECFSDMHMPLPTDSMIQLHQIADFLRDNGSEDFRVWSATLCACLRGVFTGVQHAMALVHAYPSLMVIDSLLDCLASQHNEPSRQQLLASAHTVDTTLHWDSLYTYVSNLREDDYPVYTLCPRVPARVISLAGQQSQSKVA